MLEEGLQMQEVQHSNFMESGELSVGLTSTFVCTFRFRQAPQPVPANVHSISRFSQAKAQENLTYAESEAAWLEGNGRPKI